MNGMRRLFDAIGIDYGQWLALTRTMLKLDLRSAGNFAVSATSDRSSQTQTLWMLGLFYGVTGLFLIALAFIPNAFSGALAMVSVISFMVAALLLIEFQSVVISPDDYAILAYRPISSRTFFAVKITNVLIYVGFLAALMGTPTIIVYLLASGPGRALGGVAAIGGAVVFVTLALICSYAMILRFVHPARLRRALSYLQLVLTIFVYGGYAILPRIVPMEALRELQIDKSIAVLLYPPSWFASFVDLGLGQWGLREVVPAIVGAGSIALLLWYSIDRLSLSYAERLAGLAASSEAPRRRRRGGEASAEKEPPRRWLWVRNEARAVALLVRGQYRYDMKFRMAVIGMLPLTGLYLFIGLRDGPLTDPFTNPTFGDMARLGMLHLALIFLPALLLENLASSESFRAAWVFFSTPSDKARLIVATRWLVFFCFVVPYLLFVAALLAWLFDNVAHAVTHVVVFGLIANLLLDAWVLTRPQLPFAKPPKKAERTGMMIIPMFAAMFVVMLVLPLLLTFAYASTIATATLLAALAVGNVALSWTVGRRAAALTSRLEFGG